MKRWKTGRSRKFFNGGVVGHLPQGAPTSPMLANLVCAELDTEIRLVANREALTYTRYADDMAFSGVISGRTEAVGILSEIGVIVSRKGFQINKQKTIVANPGSRRIVTGLSVAENELRIPRAYKDQLRQELFFLKKYGVEGHCSKLGVSNQLSYILRLAGRIRYVNQVEPEVGTRLLKQLLSTLPHLREIERLVSRDS